MSKNHQSQSLLTATPLALLFLACLPLGISGCSSAIKNSATDPALASIQVEQAPHPGTANGIETIAILGTNDIHGSIGIDHLKTRESSGTPIAYDVAGLPTLASYVHILKKEFGNRLLWLDGGDEFQGSIESNLEKGKTLVKFFNFMGLDGAAIGNHEFDYGAETEGSTDLLGALKTRMSEARYSYLAANIMDKGTHQLAKFPNTLPHKIYSVGQLKVGVIGLSTIDTPKTTRYINVQNLDFSDLKDATLKEAQSLREAGADLVVITSHIGLFCQPGRSTTALALRKSTDPQGECGSQDEMVELLRALPAGTVDAVVSGHSHSIVHHWVAGTPVIQGGSFGRYLNIMYLSVDLKTKKLITDRTRIEGPVPVCPKIFQNQGDCAGDRPAPKNGRGPLIEAKFHGESITPDAQVAELIAPAIAQAAELKKQVVGEAARAIEHDRAHESPLGNLVSDAVREATHADIVLLNAGGIRAPIEEGTITYGSVFRVLPFDNALVTFKVTGKELLQILRVGESGSRGFCPVSGTQLRLISPEFDAPSSDLNHDGKIDPWEIQRLIEARLSDGSKIQENKTYRLATIDFLATGGDDVGWAFQQIPSERIESSNLLIRDAAVAHIKKLSSTQGKINSTDHPLIDAQHPRIKFEKPPGTGKKKKKSRKRSKKSA